MKAEVLTLAAAPLREEMSLVICLLEPAMRSRLSMLGLRCGARVEAIQKTAGGGRIISVAGSRIAMSKSILERLQVRPIDTEAASSGVAA